MISFALILMTLPSRMADLRAGRVDRGGLPDSSREGSGGGCVRGGERLDKSSSAARSNASPARTGRYNKER
jgi:hypothetical protein